MTTEPANHLPVIESPAPGLEIEPSNPAPVAQQPPENKPLPLNYTARCTADQSARLTEFIEVLNVYKPRKAAPDGKVYSHNVVTAVIFLLDHVEADILQPFLSIPTKKKHL
jgi:hypothetical protein